VSVSLVVHVRTNPVMRWWITMPDSEKYSMYVLLGKESVIVKIGEAYAVEKFVECCLRWFGHV